MSESEAVSEPEQDHSARNKTADPPAGLRERKRAATRQTIERAAVQLALEHGYDTITVEMICHASMVSQRTFFNYFGTKEGVILGTAPPMPDEAATRAFIEGTGSIVGDLVGTIAAAIVDQVPDTELLRLRRQVLQNTPALAAKQMARIVEIEGNLLQVVLDRFRAHGRSEQATPDLLDEARMVVALGAGGMHFAMRAWFETGFNGTPRELVATAVDLINRVTGETPD
ncbi:TetR/AcrR family transcriptional regulator [Homoserinimonas sp. OAct 916]|uniref:TetR/AcrR family transcriptional regulator n=1 Tax=Homoserinimonas sp. OAct 916 TaxID=2211450 RepID=UPI000DBE0B52|nr:TetR/AcrR family transcriptional regulator [Homoserinimonas sp. OAct 916]